MPKHTWLFTDREFIWIIVGIFSKMEEVMKKILFINPPVVYVNECQKGWYSFAHPTSILKLIAWQKNLGHRVDFIDCMDYEVYSDTPSVFYKQLPLGTNHLNLYIDTFILGKPVTWLKQELQKQE